MKKLSCSRVVSNLHNHYHDTALSPNEFQCPNCEKAFVFKSGEYPHNHYHDTALSPNEFQWLVSGIPTTTTTTQPSSQTSFSALTVRKHACSRVVNIRYTTIPMIVCKSIFTPSVVLTASDRKVFFSRLTLKRKSSCVTARGFPSMA